jgi:hypothetical protein
MKEIGEIVVGIILDVCRAFVGMFLWGWFMVPLGLVAISSWHVLGLIFFFSVFSAHNPNSKIEISSEYVITDLVRTAVVLGLGFLCHLVNVNF